MKLKELITESADDDYDIFNDMLDDLSVQQLIQVIAQERKKGASWDDIEANLETLEDRADTELDDEERKALMYVLADGWLQRHMDIT